MKKYNDIVVGSGISGLTMSLLLAMNGHKVLLIEKGQHIGGSLSRFTRKGIAFDTGFHFTGGLHAGGILSDILTLFDVHDYIEPVFVGDLYKNRFIFEASGRQFEHPSGIENVKKQFKEYFPGEASTIDRYFEKVQSVCQRTPALNIHNNIITPPNLEEDYISLDAVLKDFTSNVLLRGLLSGYVMCYGVRPDEISFANHCRMILSFYESLAYVKNGGDAFINAFRTKLDAYDVEIRCGTSIRELTDIHDNKVGRFVLTTGEEITADSCVFTIHPKEILPILPQKRYSKAFANRIASFESSVGIFTAFAMLKQGMRDPYPDAGISSIFPIDDVNFLLDPSYQGDPAMVIIKMPVQEDGKQGICILEPSFPGEVERWQESRRGRRPQEYLDYKQQRTGAIREHLRRVFPAYYGESLEILDSASMLTFKEYLNSPEGSAYGVKQKMGQFNLIGKLPLHNLFAAGQSALLPGIIGAMMSSLIVGRAVMGKGQYGKLLKQTV